MKQKILLMMGILIIWMPLYAQQDTTNRDTTILTPDGLLDDQITTLSSVNPATLGSTVPDIVPPSPHSASLGRYGAVPVGLYTGTVQFSLPILN